jgi:hypothetical protein
MKAIIIAFTFLFGILSFAPNMQGGQFFKLSEVAEHYKSHQGSEEQFVSFLDFVKDHYFKNHDTKDNERNLPFKSTVASAFVLVIHQLELEPFHEYLLMVNEEKNFFGEPNSFLQQKSFSIWNPPRVV